MGVVLRKGPDAEETAQGSARFMAVHQTELADFQRQVTVGVEPVSVNKNPPGQFIGLIANWCLSISETYMFSL